MITNTAEKILVRRSENIKTLVIIRNQAGLYQVFCDGVMMKDTAHHNEAVKEFEDIEENYRKKFNW
jgi:hypothetical protein